MKIRGHSVVARYQSPLLVSLDFESSCATCDGSMRVLRLLRTIFEFVRVAAIEAEVLVDAPLSLRSCDVTRFVER